jgi:hypothetical protein
MIQEEIDEETLLCDGLEEAYIGTGTRAGQVVAVYSKEKVLEILQRDMDPEEAEECYAFNIECAYVGERTPVFLD